MRGSTFTDINIGDDSWAPRPPLEEVIEARLRVFLVTSAPETGQPNVGK